ncbi:MAG: proline dehydrogenase [Herpetosiphon sp.]
MFDVMYRRGLLSVAETSLVSRFIKQQGFKLGVGRFVAGAKLTQALDVVAGLEREGLHGILDLLGEFVATEAGANAITAEILRSLEVLGQQAVDRYMSVKPTQLGLGVSQQLALTNGLQIAQQAAACDAQICLDMENAAYVDGTLALYRALRGAGHYHVSTVLQSYLYRSQADLDALLQFEAAPQIRIVKGAYREDGSVAFQQKHDVDENFRRLVRWGLDHGAKINIATHDEAIVREVEEYIKTHGIDPDRYEFQMLYGVRPHLQRALQRRGHLVRIYVPYGDDWYGYFSRRLAERPANLWFVVRGLFG